MGDTNINNKPKQVIYICAGSKCKKRGGKQIAKSYKDLIKEMRLAPEVEIVKTECTDRCKIGPVVCFQPKNAWCFYVDENTADELFNTHIVRE